VLRQRPQVDYTRQAQTQFTRLCADSERVTYAARNVGVTTGTAGLTPGMVTVTSTDTVAEHSMGTRRKILDALDAGMPHAAGWCEVSGLDGAMHLLYMRVTLNNGTYHVTSWPPLVPTTAELAQIPVSV